MAELHVRLHAKSLNKCYTLMNNYRRVPDCMTGHVIRSEVQRRGILEVLVRWIK